MRQTFVFRDGQIIAKHLARPRETKRSDLPSPMIVRDAMEPIQGQMDGAMYDSKRAYQKAVRQAGCEIVGNEKMEGRPPQFDPEPAEADVAESMKQLGLMI